MKILKKFIILIILLFIYITFSAISYSKAICSNIYDSVLRLHVIANSDSLDDQNLKYLVRDNILNYMNSLTKNISSKEEIIKIVSDNINEFQEIAQNTIYENGFNYAVSVEIGNFNFPTKSYGDISFPAGYYDALKIKIGEAHGQNWWCVMFPPLCFIDVSSGIVPESSKKTLETQLSQEEYRLISETNSETKLKFKIIEVLQNLNFSGIFM